MEAETRIQSLNVTKGINSNDDVKNETPSQTAQDLKNQTLEEITVFADNIYQRVQAKQVETNNCATIFNNLNTKRNQIAQRANSIMGHSKPSDFEYRKAKSELGDANNSLSDARINSEVSSESLNDEYRYYAKMSGCQKLAESILA